MSNKLSTYVTASVFGAIAGAVVAALAALTMHTFAKLSCDGGKPHQYGQWSEPRYASPIEATNTFLGSPLYAVRIQERRCTNCGAATTRAVD